MDWRVLNIIEKLLECRCLKWACMTHLDIWNISYGQKKGRESNWNFDAWSLKVENHPDFLVFRWSATYLWKAFDEGYNFASDLQTSFQSDVCTQSYGSLKLQEFHLRISGQNAIWMWASWRGTKYTIWGKVVVSPKSGLWWILWVQVCPWLILASKVLQLCIN